MEKITAVLAPLMNWSKSTFLGVNNVQWLLLLATILVCFIIYRLTIIQSKAILSRIVDHHKIKFPTRKLIRTAKMAGLVTGSVFWIFGTEMIALPGQASAIVYRIGSILLTLGVVFLLYLLVDIISLYFYQRALKTENKFDDILVPLIRKTLKTFVVLMGLIMVGESFTLDMKNILAGLGIGGIAFALAAKDTISNIFGSITVLFDRPFRIGDWVVIDGKIEGTIEEVGLRSTRIRTFYNSLITLPNGQLTNVHIDNLGQRTYRRFKTTVSVQYDTPPEKIEALCEGIRHIILNHKWTRKDYFHVYFNNLSDSSLDILVYLFWKVPDWSQELAERHRLLIDILRLGRELDIKFAFPTQTVHLHQSEFTPDHWPSDVDHHNKGQSVGTTIANDPISMKMARSSTKNGKFEDDEVGL